MVMHVEVDRAPRVGRGIPLSVVEKLRYPSCFAFALTRAFGLEIKKEEE